MTVFITLEGGIVQSVHAEDPKTNVIIIDHDVRDVGDDVEIEEMDTKQCQLDEALAAGKVTAVY